MRMLCTDVHAYFSAGGKRLSDIFGDDTEAVADNAECMEPIIPYMIFDPHEKYKSRKVC